MDDMVYESLIIAVKIAFGFFTIFVIGLIAIAAINTAVEKNKNGKAPESLAEFDCFSDTYRRTFTF